MITLAKTKVGSKYFKLLKGRVEGYEFEVGILKDKIHKKPKPASAGLKKLAGGPARKMGKKSKNNVSTIAAFVKARSKINIFRKPFKLKANKEIIRFADTFLKIVMANGMMRNKRRVENLLQAIVRNPITRGDYGSNTPSTAKTKGFNRRFIDTGQLFSSIRARVIKKLIK